MSRRKINRCVECKAPLKHISNNKWMCDQSPSNCNMSIKVIFLNNPEEKEDEEEWLVSVQYVDTHYLKRVQGYIVITINVLHLDKKRLLVVKVDLSSHYLVNKSFGLFFAPVTPLILIFREMVHIPIAWNIHRSKYNLRVG